MRQTRIEGYKPYILILPAIAIFATFSIYPFYELAHTSLQSWDGISPTRTFVGLQNYLDIFWHDPVFWQSFRHAGYVTLLALTLQNAVALLLAIAVDRKIKGNTVYRTIFFIPPILSEVLVGLIWTWIYNGDSGILNQLLVGMGLGAWSRDWLSDPNTALSAIAVIHMWKGFGWGFILFLAGLQTIPDELYEAARVDGASPWYRFRHITLPLLFPVMIIVSILTILGTMQIWALIVATSQGGPGYHTEVPITRIFHSMLGTSRFGYACAQGIVFGLILLVASLVQLRFQRRET